MTTLIYNTLVMLKNLNMHFIKVKGFVEEVNYKCRGL